MPSENAIGRPTNIDAQATSRPTTWASGTQRKCTPSGRRSRARQTLAHPATRLPWVSTTPLGFPVVPEV